MPRPYLQEKAKKNKFGTPDSPVGASAMADEGGMPLSQKKAKKRLNSSLPWGIKNQTAPCSSAAVREGYRTRKEDRVRRYETIYITPPEISDDDLAQLQEKLRSILTALKGDLVKLEDWGTKKLGYEVRKNNRGRYFYMDYLALPDLVRELERNLRLSDQVLKFQTVRISAQLSPEAAQALKEAKGEKPAAAAEPPAPVEEPVPPEAAPAAEPAKAEPAEGEAK